MNITETLAQELNLRPEYVENVISLLDEGNTIPFIARYRKEMHGSMDDQVIRQLSDRATYLRGLEKRKEDVMHAISEQGKLTDALKHSLLSRICICHSARSARRAHLPPAPRAWSRWQPA